MNEQMRERAGWYWFLRKRQDFYVCVTDRPTDQSTAKHELLQRCEDASKNNKAKEYEKNIERKRKTGREGKREKQKNIFRLKKDKTDVEKKERRR